MIVEEFQRPQTKLGLCKQTLVRLDMVHDPSAVNLRAYAGYSIRKSDGNGAPTNVDQVVVKTEASKRRFRLIASFRSSPRKFQILPLSSAS